MLWIWIMSWGLQGYKILSTYSSDFGGALLIPQARTQILLWMFDFMIHWLKDVLPIYTIRSSPSFQKQILSDSWLLMPLWRIDIPPPPPGHWLQIRTTLDKRQWHLFHSLSQSTRPKITYELTVVTKVERLSFMSTQRLTLSLSKLLLSNGLHYLAMVYFVITWLQLQKALISRRILREFHRPCKGYPMNNVSIIELLVKLSRWNHGFCPNLGSMWINIKSLNFLNA